MGKGVFLMKAIVNRRIWEQKSTWILEKKKKKDLPDMRIDKKKVF